METLAKGLTWQSVLGEEKTKPYFQKIQQFVKQQRQAGKTIYPAAKDVFNALKLTPFETVKVVILGQDPYHGPNQAHGLSFSVRDGIKPPPSLVNIFTEIEQDLGIKPPNHGCLEHWAKQGVLMLNASLTVAQGQPQSHGQIGWSTFTDQVISSLNQHPEGIIFLLWGSHAQKKASLITNKSHFVLRSPHPSPLSAYRGFMGCKHFSRCNTLLEKMGRTPIDWSLPER